MKKIGTILGIIISLGIIAGAVYSFDQRKLNVTVHEEFVAANKTDTLERHRRYVQQRIWDIQRMFPNTYHIKIEYQQLVQELKQIDMKIRAYYQKRG